MNGLDRKTVLITRPDGNELAEVLFSHGANVCLCPVLKIADPTEWDSVDSAIENLDPFTWIAFVSVNGVERFLSRMRHLGAIAKLQKMMIAAIGEQTARRLNRHGLSVQLIPGRYDSHGLVQAFLEHSVTGSILLVRGDRGSDVIATALSNARISFQEVVAYRSIDVAEPDLSVLKKLRRKEVDWITITSSAIAESTVRLLGDHLGSVKLASIGPTTTAKLEALGYPPTAQAKVSDFAGIVRAMIDHEQSDQ
jgi:uroporphyrinogen III methyltransferase / synthase